MTPKNTLDEFFANRDKPSPQTSSISTTLDSFFKNRDKVSLDQDEPEPINPNAPDTSRGFKESFAEVPRLFYGIVMGGAEAAEQQFGKGGLASAVKQHALEKYVSSAEEAAKKAKPTDSATYAWKQASEKGDYGALVDFAQYWMGYVAGQGVQMVATAGVGSMVAKAAAKKVAEKTVESMVAKQTEKLLAKDATKNLGEKALKELAVKQVSTKIGRMGETAALAAASVGMEGGEIFGDLVANAETKGEKLSGEDLAKALGWSLGAGALDLVGNKFGVDLVLGRRTAKLAAEAGGITGRAARAATQAGMGAAVEGGTEFTQTLMEEAGKKHDPLSRESIMQAIDAAAVGVIGGTTMGGVGGLLTPAAQKTPGPTTETTPPTTPPPTKPVTPPVSEEPAATPAAEPGVLPEAGGLLQQIGKEQNFTGTEQQIQGIEQQKDAAPTAAPVAQAQEVNPETGEPLPPLDERDESTIGRTIMDKVQDLTVTPPDAEAKPVTKNIVPPAITNADDARQAIADIQQDMQNKRTAEPEEMTQIGDDIPPDISRGKKRSKFKPSEIDPERMTLEDEEEDAPVTKAAEETKPLETTITELEATPLPSTRDEMPAEVKKLQEESATPVPVENITKAKTLDEAIRVANDVVDGKKTYEVASNVEGQMPTKVTIPQKSLFEQGVEGGTSLEKITLPEMKLQRLQTVKEHYDTVLIPQINQNIQTMFKGELASGFAKINEKGVLMIGGQEMKALTYDEIKNSKLGLDGFEAASAVTAGFGKIPFIYKNNTFADGFFNRRPENKDYVFMSSDTDFHPVAVVAHEVFHATPELRKAVYAILKEPGMMKAGFTKVARERHDRRFQTEDGVQLDQLPNNEIQEEIGSDLLGSAMHDVERFMPKVMKHLDGEFGAPKAQQYVRDFVQKVQTYIVDLKNRFLQTTFLTPKGRAIAEEYVNDIEAFYDKLAPIVAKHYSRLSPEIAQKGLQGVIEKKTGQPLQTVLKETTQAHFVPVKSESGKLFVAKRDLPVLTRNNEYPHTIIPRGARLSEHVLNASGYKTPVVKAEPAIGSEEEFDKYLHRVEVFAKDLRYPAYMKKAAVSEERKIRTNEKRDVHLTDARWVVQRVKIDSLKEQNPDLVIPGEFKGIRRPIMTKGPIVLNREGHVIDGTNRLLEAVKAGKTTIDVFRPINTQKQDNEADMRATLGENPASPRKSGVDPVLLVTEADTAGAQKRVNTLIAMVRRYPILEGTGTNLDLIEKLHDTMVSNLLWLYKQVSPEMRARAKQWYDGANRMTKEWSSIYGVTHEQAAAVMAVTSPQQDWFNNITLAERILHIWKNRQHERVTPAMVAWVRSYAAIPTKEDAAREQLFLDIKRLESAGTSLGEMNAKDAARFIRVFDETYHDVAYRITSPEGGYLDFARTSVISEEDMFGSVTGDKISKRWLSFNPIEKAVEVLRSTEPVKPSQLSKADKVQNFYRNILDPKSDQGEVTIDTHAVAAAQIRAFSGESKEVQDAWSRAGMYEVYRRAYQDAAFKEKILPREMQSITWEAIRVLFPRSIKNGISESVDAQWKLYRHGKQTLAQTRNNIFNLAGGLDKFMWEKGGTGLFPAQGGRSFDADVHEQVDKRKGRVLQPKGKPQPTKAVDTTGMMFSPKSTTRLEHYSRVEGLTTINPDQQGTGQAGAERTRAANAEPGTYVPRSYYYRAGAKPEPRFKGTHQYVVEVNEHDLFDMAGAEGDITLIEQKAKNDGYVGAYNSDGVMPEAVMLFEAQDVLQPPSVEELHMLAEEKGLEWDNNPDFMKMTKEVTGKKHLDSLNGAQRLMLQYHLERMDRQSYSPISREQFASAKEPLKESYKKQITGYFNSFVNRYGPTLDGIYNTPAAMLFRESVAKNLTREANQGLVVKGSPYRIDEERLDQNAEAYANNTIDEAIQKLQAKIGNIDDLKAHSLHPQGGSISFLVTGKRGNDNVRIEQNMIINVSSRGKLFNQWPARISINGKQISEKAYQQTAFAPKMDENEISLPAGVEQEIVDFEIEHGEEIEDLKAKLTAALGGRIAFSPKSVRGSKVKHAVYHGTDQNFEEFEIPSSGMNSTVFGSYNVSRHAAFFAKDPLVAEQFAMQHNEKPAGQRIIKLFIDLRNPLDLRDGLSEKDESHLLNGINLEERRNFVRYLSSLYNDSVWALFDDENEGETNARILDEAGYDGIIYNETFKGKIDKTSYAVLRSEQASLAPNTNTEILPSHGHPIAYSNKMTEEDTRMANEYDSAPNFDQAAVPSWDALKAETSRLYRQVALKVKIIRVTGQPYTSAEEMNNEIASGVMQVTTDHSEHPLWNVDENFEFRAVHDYIGHFETGFDFTLDGERAAYAHHAAQISPEARPALRVEVYGQAAAAIAHGGEFQTQKIFLPQEVTTPKQLALNMKEKVANLKRFLTGSKVKKPVFHTTVAGGAFTSFKRGGELGIHLGTAGQANDRFQVKIHADPFGPALRDVSHATIKAYISLKNPLRMKDQGTWTAKSMHDDLEKKFPKDNVRDLGSPAEIREFLQAKGYDGIIYKNTGESEGLNQYRVEKDEAFSDWQELREVRLAEDPDSAPTYKEMEAEITYNLAADDYDTARREGAEDSYIVFEPNQVKSAIGNRGTYDPTKRDMLLAPKQLITLNIGLDIGDSKDALSKEEAVTELEKHGVTVLTSSVQRSKTENTLVVTLDRPLTPEEAYGVSENLRQQSIAQKVGNEGELYGPGAEQWRPFLNSEFKTQLRELLLAPKKKAKPAPPANFPPAVKYTVDQPTKLDWIVRGLQDKNIDIARLVDAVKHAGGTIPTEANPVLREEMYHKLVSQMDADFENDELLPMLELMRVNKVTMEQLNDYLQARHILNDNLNAKLDLMNPGHPNQGKLAGQTDAWAQQVMKDTNLPTMLPIARRVDAIMKKTRQMMVGYGLETQKTINEWESLYKSYVPLRREGFEDEGYGLGPGRSVKGSTVKTRLGSGREVSHILANIAEARSQIIGRGERQKPVKAMAALLMMHPNKDIAVLAKPAPLTVTNPLTGLTEIVPGDITLANGSTYKVPTIKRLNKDTGEVQVLPDPTYKGRPNVVNFRVEGKDYAIVFNEENDRAMEMAKAFKNLDTPALNGVMAAVAPYTRFMASINTQYNPIFGIINFVRDVQFAMLTLQNTPLAGAKADVLRNTMTALEGIYDDARAVRHGLHPTSPTSVMWERFQHVGGPTGYRDIFLTVTDRAKHLQELLTPKGWSEIRTPSEFGTKVSKTALFEWLSDYNTTMENAVRLGVFKAAVDRGISDIEAASIAKNITVNFNKKGQIGAQMGSLFAFFNANVQGTGRLLETLFEPIKPGQQIALSSVGKKIIAGGVLVGVLQAFMLAIAGYEEDDVPEFVKQRTLILPVPGTDKGYVQVPMPLGFNILPNIGRLAAETVIGFVRNGNGKPIEHAYDLISAIASAFIPVGGSSSLIQTVLPTVLDPIAGLEANMDWTGRPIYREDLDRRNPTPGHTRMRDSATVWAQAISRAINFVTGGNEYRPGIASPTPDAIDYVISQVTGGVGRETSKFSQLIEGAVVGKEVPIYKVPIIGRFVGSASGASSVRDRYYETVKQINVNYNELKGRAKAGDDADEFLAEHPEAKLHKAVSATETLLHKLNNRKRQLIANEAPRDAVKLVDEQITSAMQRLNSRYIEETQR